MIFGQGNREVSRKKPLVLKSARLSFLQEKLVAMNEFPHTLFIEDLSHIDFALFEPSVGVVGQTWNLSIELSGPLNEVGFIYDFSP